MKRVIAVSDSHGSVGNLRAAVKLALDNGKIDVLVYLGDGFEDFQAVQPLLRAACPDIVIYAVRGNNDWYFSVPNDMVFFVDGVRFYACHGHEWRVKYGMERLSYAASEREATVALYGHTHISHMERLYGVLMVNPGAICERMVGRAAYADICVEEKGHIRADLIRWK